jgi:hypothetical protein
VSGILTLSAQNPSGLFLLNVALAGTGLAGLGLLAARWLAAHPAPLRHAVLMAALLLLPLAPLLVVLSMHWGLGLFGLPGAAPAPARVWAHGAAGGPGVDGLFGTARALALQGWAWSGPLLLFLWSVGAAWRGTELARGLWLVQRLRRSLLPVTDLRWLHLAGRASRAVGLPRPARVAVSHLLAAPVSLGVFRPVIVVPASLEGVLGEADIEGILLHEAAHLARKDQLAGLLQRVVRIGFWWSPWVRSLCAALDDVQEELCDSHVVQAQGSGAAFARCLVTVAEWALRCRALPAAPGLLGRRGLEHRLTNLLRKGPPPPMRLTRRMAGALTVFVLAACGLIVAGAVRPAPSAPLPEPSPGPPWMALEESLPALPKTVPQEARRTSPMRRSTPAMLVVPALRASRPAEEMGLPMGKSLPAVRTVPARAKAAPGSRP